VCRSENTTFLLVFFLFLFPWSRSLFIPPKTAHRFDRAPIAFPLFPIDGLSAQHFGRKIASPRDISNLLLLFSFVCLGVGCLVFFFGTSPPPASHDFFCPYPASKVSSAHLAITTSFRDFRFFFPTLPSPLFSSVRRPSSFWQFG